MDEVGSGTLRRGPTQSFAASSAKSETGPQEACAVGSPVVLAVAAVLLAIVELVDSAVLVLGEAAGGTVEHPAKITPAARAALNTAFLFMMSLPRLIGCR